MKSKQGDLDFLKIAVGQAKLSIDRGGFPAGSVIVKNNEVIAKGMSLGSLLNDPIGHAETSSIRKACKKLKTTDLDGATLYASLEPCLMFLCFKLVKYFKNCIWLSKIGDGIKIVLEGTNDLKTINNRNSHKIETVFIPNFEEEVLELIKIWRKIFVIKIVVIGFIFLLFRR